MDALATTGPSPSVPWAFVVATMEIAVVKWSIVRACIALAGLIVMADARPAQAAPGQYAINIDSRKALAWYPLLMPLDRGLVVSIVINGKPINAAIDTGNTEKTGLSVWSAAAAGLGITRTDEHSTVMTYTGVRSLSAGMADRVEIGGISMSNVPVSIKDSEFSADVPVVIGAKLLDFMTLVVDPAARRVRFLFPGELAVQKDGPGLIALTDHGHFLESSAPFVSCAGNARLVLDTGDNNDVSIKSALVEPDRCGAVVESTVLASTGGGPLVSRRFGAPAASIGGIALGATLVTRIADDRARELAIDGTIGLGILGRFRFALDTSSRRMLILGDAGPRARFQRPTIGLQFDQIAGEVHITHVEAHSPASRSALRAGDKVCAVGDTPIVRPQDLPNMNPTPGTVVKITPCGGRAVSIVASDFFFPSGVSLSADAAVPDATVGKFTSAVADCLYGADGTKVATCTTVIESPPETRAIADFRVVAFLFRARGKSALGDARGAADDYRRVLALDPSNSYAATALKAAGS